LFFVKLILKTPYILTIFFIEKIILLIFFAATAPLIFRRGANIKSVLWGVDPIINNIYWARANKKNFSASDSVVKSSADSFIAKSTDYDYQVEYFRIPFPKTTNKEILRLYTILNSIFIFYKYDLFFLSFNGGPLHEILGRLELAWLKFCRKRIVVFPFGYDSYVYSELGDKTLQHALLLSQGSYAFENYKIQKRKKYFFKYIDIYISSFQDNFIPRWDFVRPTFLCVDTKKFSPSDRAKKNKIVVAHAPNHRGFKGTPFIQKAVDELIAEGLNIEFLLLEGINNDEIAKIYSKKVDILVDQLIFQGYALNAIEAMSSGVAVISNLEDCDTVRLFKRYSFLNECPIYSANIENIKQKLKELITNDNLREELVNKGREYVSRYHSYNAIAADFKFITENIENKNKLLNYNFKFNNQNEKNRFR